MLYSRQHRFLFVHNPKTGGLSVTRALARACPDLQVDLEGRHGVLGDPRPELFTFVFVRHPLTRMVSAYEFFHQRTDAIWHRHVRGKSFAEWLGAGPNPTWFPPQVSYARHCRFVGRFERLETDFASFCGRLGVEAELPHLQSSRVADYAAYFDPRCREIVAHHYAEDFVAFDYPLRL